MLNHITIMGRLTRDPELRRTQSGLSVTTFSVAVERDYQSRDAAEKQTDFIDVVAWRQTAEFICRYFSKGRMIVVDGSLQSRKWQDKNGQNRVSWEVQANNVYFGDSRRDSAPGNDYGTPPPYGTPVYNTPGTSGGESGAYSSPAASYSSPAQSYGGGPSSGGFDEIEEDGELPF